MPDPSKYDDVGDRIEDIAIIGMAGRFPGAKNLIEFWQNLRHGVESITFFSDLELETTGFEPTVSTSQNHVKAGAILEDVDRFDAAFFGINPKEAELTDPQQRFFLECAWEALEDAGYSSETRQGSIGIYAGSGTSTYLLNPATYHAVVASVGAKQIEIGNDKDFLTTRVGSWPLFVTS